MVIPPLVVSFIRQKWPFNRFQWELISVHVFSSPVCPTLGGRFPLFEFLSDSLCNMDKLKTVDSFFNAALIDCLGWFPRQLIWLGSRCQILATDSRTDRLLRSDEIVLPRFHFFLFRHEWPFDLLLRFWQIRAAGQFREAGMDTRESGRGLELLLVGCRADERSPNNMNCFDFCLFVPQGLCTKHEEHFQFGKWISPRR